VVPGAWALTVAAGMWGLPVLSTGAAGTETGGTATGTFAVVTDNAGANGVVEMGGEAGGSDGTAVVLTTLLAIVATWLGADREPATAPEVAPTGSAVGAPVGDVGARPGTLATAPV
jgi:hypothetical protein